MPYSSNYPIMTSQSNSNNTYLGLNPQIPAWCDITPSSMQSILSEANSYINPPDLYGDIVRCNYLKCNPPNPTSPSTKYSQHKFHLKMLTLLFSCINLKNVLQQFWHHIFKFHAVTDIFMGVFMVIQTAYVPN